MSLLTKDQLNLLTTKRLIAYKNKLMKVPEGPNWEEGDTNRLNKTSEKWQETYLLVKEILATREHVEKKS